MWIFDSSIDKKMNSLAVLLARLVAGTFMLTHGILKFHMLFKGGPVEFADPIGIGQTPSLVLSLFAELVCSVFLIIGLATRFITIPLIINMFVVVFEVHAGENFQTKELPGLYLLIYVLLFITGSGKYSIDGIISNKKGRR